MVEGEVVLKQRTRDYLGVQNRLSAVSWMDLNETVLFQSPGEEIRTKEPYLRINLSSIPRIPDILDRIGNGELEKPATSKERLALLTGSALHRLYTIGLFLKRGGGEKEIPIFFPTLATNPRELNELRSLVSKAEPFFRENEEEGLRVLWQEIYDLTTQELKRRFPMFTQDIEGIEQDELYADWKNDGSLEKGNALASKIARNFDDDPVAQFEPKADKTYFELGLICIINPLKMIVVMRLDELITVKKSGKPRRTWAVDFKSGKYPQVTTNADKAYEFLMRMAVERLMGQYISKGKMNAQDGYIRLIIDDLDKVFLEDSATVVFRYQDEKHPFHFALNTKPKEEIISDLIGWTDKMREYHVKEAKRKRK